MVAGRESTCAHLANYCAARMDKDDFLAATLRNPIHKAIADELYRVALPDECYLTTPEINPALRRGGFISFFRKQCAARPI
jgi:hypothetical protein